VIYYEVTVPATFLVAANDPAEAKQLVIKEVMDQHVHYSMRLEHNSVSVIPIGYAEAGERYGPR
jgi:hypothetical protein